jgi:aquaporin Z
MHKYFIEFIGTFVFITIILNSSRYNYKSYAPLAIGLGLAAVIQFGGSISGGHYNPAVSFASFLNNDLNNNDLIYYALEAKNATLTRETSDSCGKAKGSFTTRRRII